MKKKKIRDYIQDQVNEGWTGKESKMILKEYQTFMF